MHATAVLGNQEHETKPDISLSMLLFISNNGLEATGRGVYGELHAWDDDTVPPSFLISKWRLNTRRFLFLDHCGEGERHTSSCLDY